MQPTAELVKAIKIVRQSDRLLALRRETGAEVIITRHGDFWVARHGDLHAKARTKMLYNDALLNGRYDIGILDAYQGLLAKSPDLFKNGFKVIHQ